MANSSSDERIIAMSGIVLVRCDACDGCGCVTDTPHRIPWIWHTRELRDAQDQPIFPEAKPSQCGKCHGTGKIERFRLTATKMKRKKP